MKRTQTYWKSLFRKKYLLLVFGIFLFELFLRTYNLGFKDPFGFDQVDNAWAAKNIIINHWYPLVGMVAKTDSGIFIGPAYYYFAAFFYWIYNLNPIASEAIAVVSAVFTFWTIFYVVKKLFCVEIAIIALLINTFCFNTILFDGIQWPVQLLPAVSLIIFYLLYRVILGDVKKLIPLAIAIGVALNLHFTAIFFPIIVILTLPLFPRTKETLKYILISFPCFFVWLIPNLASFLLNKTSASAGGGYLTTYFLGFHLRRMLQLTGDAIIQFDPYLLLAKIKPLKVIILPVFMLVYLFKSFNSAGRKFVYLVLLWFLIPWLVFTTYGGEISDYYFIISRFVALIILSYFIYLVWNTKNILAKLFVVLFLIIYCAYGFITFLPYKDEGSLYKHEQAAKQVVDSGRRIEFQVGVPESYLYYYYMRQKGIAVYISKYR
ncbi:MAG TPA: hypothetical protein VMR77_03130 [Patescibacteria group bacterium]|nr:hypothetical protein [Patescibacteria group bacterium]